MDKETLSQYGWVVIAIIVLIIMIALATPFGTYVAKAAKASVVAFSEKTDSMFDDNGIAHESPEFADVAAIDGSSVTNYSDDEIATDENLIGIGATNPNYVVYRYDPNTHTVTISANGQNTDGLMKDDPRNKDFLSNATSDEALMALADNDIQNVVIEKGVKNVGAFAFTLCTALNSVSLPNTIESIGAYAFTASSISNVELPKSLTFIDEYAFSQSGLTSIKIPNSVTAMGESAFYQCVNLSDITLSKNCSLIPLDCFYNAPITSLVVPEGVTDIEENAFRSNVLMNVKLPTTISDEAGRGIYTPSGISAADGCVFSVKAGSAAEQDVLLCINTYGKNYIINYY